MSEVGTTPQDVAIDFLTKVALIALQEEKATKDDIEGAIDIGWESLSWLNQPGNFKLHALKNALNSYFSEEGEQSPDEAVYVTLSLSSNDTDSSEESRDEA